MSSVRTNSVSCSRSNDIFELLKSVPRLDFDRISFVSERTRYSVRQSVKSRVILGSTCRTRIDGGGPSRTRRRVSKIRTQPCNGYSSSSTPGGSDVRRRDECDVANGVAQDADRVDVGGIDGGSKKRSRASQSRILRNFP